MTDGSPTNTYPSHPVSNGFIAIGHRPRIKHLPAMKRNGVTLVVSILGKQEDAERLGQLIMRAQMEWIWIPIGSSQPPTDRKTLETVAAALSKLELALHAGGTIFIHCSAGIHRTGMIANALLLYLGYSQEKARSILEELRQVTSENVGSDRLSWGIQFRRD